MVFTNVDTTCGKIIQYFMFCVNQTPYGFVLESEQASERKRERESHGLGVHHGG